ncbi:hypothetical protein OGAPHI_006579 [Ogataea philodendri]|uniref:Phosphoacetylglucosamine mutase n=1 Tax=Ogataea philodendri TaxID=1378263 RepID=A0A9P8NX39_9ASCO|nr:uncharacterized protein OGAPHI_006579 [Ogataea philodendri]KAH3661172.1 hypothetical protein OGAPHI_006579 [Ogataea philodendri]
MSLDPVLAASKSHPKPPNAQFAYGTAGFRTLGAQLDSTVFRVGVLAALRSAKLEGKTIGVMITASHNPPQDNGVKLVDPLGEMLPQVWEPYATQLANSEDLLADVEDIVAKENIDVGKAGLVIVGRDTRETGPELVTAALDGINVFSQSKDFGELTTPQLHYLVRSHNDPEFGEPTEQGYIDKTVAAVEKIMNLWNITDPIKITVDAANGVGALKLKKLKSSLIAITVINDNTRDKQALNVDCGADFVKTNQKLPANVQPTPDTLYSSFDGDADRVVFYYMEGQQFRLLDGDRIATLLASLLNTLLQKVQLKVKLGIIQTAYANGSSTKYIEEQLKVPVAFTPTGVKHLHHKAQEYDIGVYFEANGHGTVLFSDEYIKLLKTTNTTTEEQQKALQTLQLLVEVINQTVGDSISDLLAVLLALKIENKSCRDWADEYTELPNKLFKVLVADRFAFKTANAERQLVEPAGLQEQIDALVQQFPQGRSFVRASGTENAVRVYSEAASETDCLELGNRVCKLLEKY